MIERRVALITGGASGLAVQTVLALAREGIDLVINYRESREKAEALKQRVEREYGVFCELIQGDVTKREDCLKLAREARRLFGHVDILINNAGPYIFTRKKMVDYSFNEWEQVVQGNLSAVFYLCKELIPAMREKNWGRIINFGFNQANHAPGWVHRSAFAAAKVGLVSLTKTLALEEAEHGITVNMICPGDIVAENKEKRIGEVRGKDAPGIAPVGRAGTGEDIARVVSFLCAPDSDFITGSVIEVSGGFDVLRKRGDFRS